MLASLSAVGTSARKEGLLTLRQACQLAGVAPITLRRWTNEGKLNCLRTIGGSRRFRSSEILAAFGQAPDETTVGEESRENQSIIPIAVVIRVSSKGQALGEVNSFKHQEERLRE